MPIKNHLYVHDGQHLSVGEACPVFGEFRVENYLTGRCHLMALALSEGAGLTCAVLLDVEAGYDADDEPVAALEHAFVELGQGAEGVVVDARGGRQRSDVLAEYDQAFSPELIVGKKAEDLIRRWISVGLLEDYAPGEREGLALYVQALQKYPCLTLLPEDSPWHAYEPSHDKISQPLVRVTGVASSTITHDF
ncbi:hypothetical protein V0M98_37030 (plasmid) [Pseudomonas silesiensis]|uniref:hypothetical protein n=1 Tax=Pseudomonas silesiensis TaxID=1853130 RepID=UPI0030D46DB2